MRTTPSWWDAVRIPIAFLVAPLVVPLLAVLVLDAPLSDPSIVALLIVVTFATYVGVAAFGVPTFLLMRSRQWTEFWMALTAGFIIGTVMWYVGARSLSILSLGKPLVQMSFHQPWPPLLNGQWPCGSVRWPVPRSRAICLADRPARPSSELSTRPTINTRTLTRFFLKIKP